jgi:hypothetical protein
MRVKISVTEERRWVGGCMCGCGGWGGVVQPITLRLHNVKGYIMKDILREALKK